MKRLHWIRQRTLGWVGASLLIAVIGVGCPLFGGNDVPLGMAKVTTVLTADSSPVKTVLDNAVGKQGEVPLDQIESLVVTVEKIELLREDDVEDEDPEDNGDDSESENDSKGVDDEGDDNGDDNGDDGGPVEVYSGSIEVDLVDLVGVSEVLSSMEIPAGEYKRIILTISNPMLVLASDTETVITNVMLTANGRVFVNGEFEVEDGENRILQIDLGGIHLVPTGNGKYVLTPQLQADIEVTQLEDVVAVGEIVGIDPDNDTFDLMLDEGVSAVFYTGADIYLPMELDPTGTENDLVVGAVVDVEGILQLDGSITAEAIRILSLP